MSFLINDSQPMVTGTCLSQEPHQRVIMTQKSFFFFFSSSSDPIGMTCISIIIKERHDELQRRNSLSRWPPNRRRDWLTRSFGLPQRGRGTKRCQKTKRNYPRPLLDDDDRLSRDFPETCAKTRINSR